jgi:hypothetical protein
MESTMETPTFDSMSMDVAKHFATPKDILVDQTLTRSQKIKLLQQWDYDMQLLLAASDESMTNSDVSKAGAVAERIRALRLALAELGAAHDPEASGPAKVA